MTSLAVMFGAPFMQHALMATVLLAVVSAIVGTALNLRNLEFAADGFVHAIFPGVVVGFVIGGGEGPAMYVGAALAAVFATGILTWVSRSGVSNDTTTAVLLAGAFAVGIVIVSRATNYATGLEHLLFGQLLTIDKTDLVSIAVLGAIASTLVVATWKQQLFIAFDRAGALAAGLRIGRYELILNFAIALTVVATARVVGNLLVLGLLIVPVAVGRMLSYRLRGVILIAAVCALGACVLGLVSGYWLAVDAGLNVSPSAVLVLTLVAVYLAVVGGTSLARRRRSTRASASSTRMSRA